MDWNLRACGRHGHVTYAPTEADLRERLHAETPVGTAWRCLRCGDFVLGEPRLGGAAADAPIVLRGRALRDAVILRLLSLERFTKGLAVLAAGYGVFRFRSHRDAVARAFNEDIPLLKPLADKVGYNLQDSAIVHEINTVISASTKTLLYVAIALVTYGVLQLIEGTGLWLLKRWGEYFAVLATSLGLPIEIYELAHKLSWVKVATFLVNVAAVLYILLSKRLFGLRGGHAAYEAERHETSLLEVETAGVQPLLRRRRVHPDGTPRSRVYRRRKPAAAGNAELTTAGGPEPSDGAVAGAHHGAR